MKRSIAILSRVRRQLPSRPTAHLPAKQRGHAVQRHHAHAEDCVKCFEHSDVPFYMSDPLARLTWEKEFLKISFLHVCDSLALLTWQKEFSSFTSIVIVIIVTATAAEHAFGPATALETDVIDDHDDRSNRQHDQRDE